MPSAFTTENVPALEAVGCVRNGDRNSALTLSIENDAVLHCVSDDGFRVSIHLRACPAAGGRIRNIRCTLGNGVEITCRGRINPVMGSLRLDADDQTEYSWFRFAIRPNFRREFTARLQ